MHRAIRKVRRLLVLLALLLSPAFAPADAPPANDAAREAGEAARAAIVRGPTSITLKDQAVLALPEHFGFIPRKEAAALMDAMGNRVGDRFLGLIVPLQGGSRAGRWFVSVDFDPAGYVKDDDARHWDADKLLTSLRDGTEAANEERQKRGIPPIAVTRWIEPPAYDAASHQLIWSAEAKLKNGNDPDPTINYNTYVLGREGYLELNLVTSASAVEGDKAAARELLSAVQFNSGKRYGDFNSSTDKVAAYGLAALVAGVAAKKLGLLAILAATLVKFAKVIAIGAAGGFAALGRWWKSRTGRAT
ncbi:MAG: DUF2167 domain-containing protein [Proteobacteria bacterium]|nr:DUF2167 domain-containing protein [Pseudomonadota bacterium]